MRRDDDEPFDDFFSEIERMMNGVFDGRVDRNGDDASRFHVDTQQYDDELRVVVDVPGIGREAIDLKCDGEVLTLTVSPPGRERGRQTIGLPVAVDERSASATFNNGVLEVTFDRVGGSADIDLN
ncbi:Hsp20/alpha crystallin family protein [Halobacteriales archaeon SW_7_68_16]|nr:MAG: Hsp20/alpha crystallin family protein [Halobacteriales archaeon SW_7_68_16]